MAEQAIEEVTETTAETTEEATLQTEVPELPEWLQGPEYEELLSDETNKNIVSRYKSPQEAAKAVIEKEKTVRSGFKIPKKLNDEQLAELRTHINRINGVPEKPEGYAMQRPEEVDEKLDLSEQTKMELRAVAKERNIGNDDFQAIYETALYAMKRAAESAEAARIEQHETERKATVALMQKYFGPQEYLKIAGDDKKDGLIDQLFKSRAIDEDEFNDLFDKLDRTGLRNHPLLFKVMGDAARFYEILEGRGKLGPTQFAQTGGNKKLSADAKRAQSFPKTPQSLGGGAPD